MVATMLTLDNGNRVSRYTHVMVDFPFERAQPKVLLQPQEHYGTGCNFLVDLHQFEYLTHPGSKTSTGWDNYN
jgi:hypothetical protein